MLGEVAQIRRYRVLGHVQLTQEGSVDDEVGVATDRRREMAIGGARETGMTEVAGVVAGLLQRTQHERRESLPPPPRLRGVDRDELARLRRESGGVGRGHVFRRRRRRHLQVSELRQQELDRLRLRPLVHAEQRLSAPTGEQRGHALVRQDHQLLDEHVRMRLLRPPGTRDAAVRVELELDLGRLDTQRSTGKAPLTQAGRDRFRAFQRLG